MFDFVAILGRGIQRLSKDGPWVLTEDLEVCDTNSAHLPVRVPVNDEDPYCMVGGGEMNLEAGRILIERYRPTLIVCAYGHRSAYLESINGPTESEVMSTMLRRDADNARLKIAVWERNRKLSVPSNTRQELLNIFDLALKRGLPRIALVTVGVHVPRTATYITKHLSLNPEYQALTATLFESEEILLGVPEPGVSERAARVKVIRDSRSFARNWEREAVGISKIVRDVYGDAKPKVELPEPTVAR